MRKSPLDMWDQLALGPARISTQSVQRPCQAIITKAPTFFRQVERILLRVRTCDEVHFLTLWIKRYFGNIQPHWNLCYFWYEISLYNSIYSKQNFLSHFCSKFCNSNEKRCSQWAHNVERTSTQRWFNVKTLNKHWIDVVSTLCACRAGA